MIGYAYIRDYNHSLKCKNLFLNDDKLIMECVFDSEKSKWIPDNISKIKKIDILNKSRYIDVKEEFIDFVEY